VPVAIISTHGLRRCYGKLAAVAGLELSVEPGEVYGLLGPNGAGKTTVIKMLTTLLPPTAGTALIDGHDIRKQPGLVRRSIGYVPQMLSADGALTGAENLLIMGKLYDIPGRELHARVDEALAYMGLSDSAGNIVRTYSGGMIRRLEIAQSLLHRPQVLFLDEPTVGLDPAARLAVWDYIERLKQDFGTTILLTTHLMEEAEELCARLMIMHHGATVAQGTPAELKAATGDPQASLNEVFIFFAKDSLESQGGSYRETRRMRRTTHRLG
jgi:ABC-2 type transport system ATP-binding protein